MYQRPDLLDTRRLRLLYELSLRGTLSEVAEALHQSPSSVSQALNQLEREVGVPLLEKVGRRLRLTPAARCSSSTPPSSWPDSNWPPPRSPCRVTSLRHRPAGRLPISGIRLHASDAHRIGHPPSAVTRHHVPARTRAGLYETWMREFDLVIAEEYPGHAARVYPDLHREPLTTDLLRLAVPPTGDPWRRITSVKDTATCRGPWSPRAPRRGTGPNSSVASRFRARHPIRDRRPRSADRPHRERERGGDPAGPHAGAPPTGRPRRGRGSATPFGLHRDEDRPQQYAGHRGVPQGAGLGGA